MKDGTKTKKQLIEELEALQRHNHQLSVLYKISSIAGQSLNLEKVLNDAIEATLDAFEVEAGGIFLLEPDGETMTLRAHCGVSDRFAKNVQQIKLAEGVSGRAAAEKRPIALDVSEFPTDRLRPFIIEEGFQTMVSTPLLSDDKVVGAMNLSRRCAHVHTPEELELLSAIGQQLGVLVHKAQLHERVQKELTQHEQAEEELRKHREHLEEMVETRTAELMESESKFRRLSQEFDALLNTISDNLCRISPDLKILWANRHCAFSLGKDISDLVGQHCYKLWYDRNTPCESCPVKESFLTGNPESKEGLTADGRIWDLRTFPIKDEAGRVTSVVEVGRDITEHKKAEEKLKIAIDEWRVTFDSATDIIMLLNTEMKIIKANLATAKFLSKPLDEILGKNCFQLFHGIDKIPAACPLEKIKKTKKHEEGEIYLSEKDIWIWSSVDPIFDDKNNLIRSIHIIKDITEYKRAEEEVKQYAERLKTLSTRLLEVQEDERRYIARELHDEIGQVLTGLKFTLEAIHNLPAEDITASLSKAQTLVSELMDRVHNLSLNLRPSILDDLGLLPALVWHFERYTAQTNVHVIPELNPRLSRGELQKLCCSI